jgi:hypothetical protein
MYTSGDAEAARRAMEQMLTMTKLDLEPLERAFAGEAVGSTTR